MFDYDTHLNTLRGHPRGNPAVTGEGDPRAYFKAQAESLLAPGIDKRFVLDQARQIYARGHHGSAPDTPEAWCEALGVLALEWERQEIGRRRRVRRADAFFAERGL